MRESWIEKYRPETISDMLGNEKNLKRVESYVKARNLKQHILFAGGPGIGKTTAALAVGNELYGTNLKGNFYELNASDDNSIKTVRTKIKSFATSAPIGDLPFKILLLDEADALTSEAQSALRRTMEKYAENCKFILTCNYPNKIIEAIQDRCQFIRLKPFTPKEYKILGTKIIEAESVNITEDAFNLLCKISTGSARKFIGQLQFLASIDEEINISDIKNTYGYVDIVDMKKLIMTASQKNMKGVQEFLLKLLKVRGYSHEEIIVKLTDLLIQAKVLRMPSDGENVINSKLLEYLLEKLDHAANNITLGANIDVSLLCLFGHFMKISEISW